MSLLIEGMKMPEYKDVFGDGRHCVYLLMLSVKKDGTAYLYFNDVEGGFYQVKEISAPHGRLIDADDLDSITVVTYPNTGDPLVAGRLKKIIAPTIIEAEVGE